MRVHPWWDLGWGWGWGGGGVGRGERMIQNGSCCVSITASCSRRGRGGHRDMSCSRHVSVRYQQRPHAWCSERLGADRQFDTDRSAARPAGASLRSFPLPHRRIRMCRHEHASAAVQFHPLISARTILTAYTISAVVGRTNLT